MVVDFGVGIGVGWVCGLIMGLVVALALALALAGFTVNYGDCFFELMDGGMVVCYTGLLRSFLAQS